MRKWKVIQSIMPILMLGILLVSCYDVFKCPPYPEHMAKFMPVQYNGGKQEYLIGEDTCVFGVGQLSLSKGYKEKSYCGGDHCEASASQSLEINGLYSITYRQERWTRYSDHVKFFVLIENKGTQRVLEEYWLSYNFEDNEHAQQSGYEILPEYMAPTGKTYSNTLFFVDAYYKDSVWVSYNEGLVRYVPAQADTTALGQVWQLLP